MNQVLFGDVLIDTDDIYFSCIDEGAETFGGTRYTRVMFKHGQGERLEGEAKAAFDKWAKGRPKAGRCGECGKSLTEYLTDGLGQRVKKLTLSVTVESIDTPGGAVICLACAGFDVVMKEDDVHGWTPPPVCVPGRVRPEEQGRVIP